MRCSAVWRKALTEMNHNGAVERSAGMRGIANACCNMRLENAAAAVTRRHGGR